MLACYGSRIRGAVLALLFAVAVHVHAEDWPTCQHDVARSGITEEELKLPLSEQWAFISRHAPQPAWSDPRPWPSHPLYVENRELPRVDFDKAYHVAVVGNSVCFGSSADNKVYSLDASTGKVRWSFFTGGPVRLAPAVSDGRVFVGSDDGYVYCLAAANGELIWKLRAAPSGKKVLGHGKMISLWPVRTGVLVDSGVAYFGAGIFPAEGVYVYAVRAKDGELIWKNDTCGQQRAGQSGFSPQGYLLASPDALYVPSGRALPAAFGRKDGRFIYQRDFSKYTYGPLGGTYALLSGDHLFSGTDQIAAYEQKTGNIGFAWFPGRRLILTAGISYMLTDEEISALDRKRYRDLSKTRNALNSKRLALRSERWSGRVERRKKKIEKCRNELAELKRRIIDH